MIGFDVNQQRISELLAGQDRTNETSLDEMKAATGLELTADPAKLAEADVFIVSVPTPIDDAKRPNLTPLERASATVGRALKMRSALGFSHLPLVIYESTVYPGATEEVCVPILERESDLAFNQGFVCVTAPSASTRVTMNTVSPLSQR